MIVRIHDATLGELWVTHNVYGRAMTNGDPPTSNPDRRQIMAVGLAGVIIPMPGPARATAIDPRKTLMKLTCVIRYQIDPAQRDAFKTYAETWGPIIPRCGGELVGYFLPYEGTNDVGWGLISFGSLASYEAYRTKLKADPDALANLAMAQSKRVIVREERNFVEIVAGTYGLPTRG